MTAVSDRRRPSRRKGFTRTDSRPAAGNEGTALVLALLILGALAILATTAIVTSMGDRNASSYDRDALQALGAAETGVAYAKRAIINCTAPLGDLNQNGRPDFQLADTLPWGGTYQVWAEASDIKGEDITAYQSNGWTIVSEGQYKGARRRVCSQIVHDSFLKFARFVSQNDLSYACGAAISGQVYTGGDLDVPCGCGNNQECQFLENVYAVGDIPNSTCAQFYKGYVTHADAIDLSNSFNWTDIKNKAKGLGADNTCEGKGSIGIYMKLSGTDPLHLGSQASPNQNVLRLDLFDFHNTTLSPPDTIITYNGTAVPNPLTGHSLKAHDFNGIIYFDGAGKVKGTADGVSGRCLSIFSTTTCTVMSDIVTGHTGYDPVTRLPNGTGNPVNIGLIADSYVGMDAGTCKVLRVDAALLSRTSNWCGLGTESTHPNAGPGALDLDLDGIFGETPVNNDPVPGQGWDELHYATNPGTQWVWVINLNGPIITATTGDAQPWNNTDVLAHALGPTRRYNYDMDITEYPPPCFPVPLNLWKDVSWTEIFDLSQPLTANLPN